MQDVIDFVLKMPEDVIYLIFLIASLPLAFVVLKITIPILNSLKPLPVYDEKIGGYRLPKRPGEKRLAYWAIVFFALQSVILTLAFSALPWWFAILLAGFVILVTWFASFLGRTKQIWTGGIIGSALVLTLGLLVNADLTNPAFWIMFLTFGASGLLIDLILSRNYRKQKAGKKSTGYWSSWGGFKRFGGGNSGGGGASGSW